MVSDKWLHIVFVHPCGCTQHDLVNIDLLACGDRERVDGEEVRGDGYLKKCIESSWGQ
jgi:hypothetical protein